MLFEEKIRLLKGIRLLKDIPERQLNALAEFLRPKELADGAFVFEEGSLGMSLYFVSSGQIRISKRVADKAYKDLAIIGPGDFFGETALAAETPRSASAIASGPCLLFELFRGDLSRWVKLNPQLAVQFFAELVNLQSKRLRRTSNELTLHFDISELLAHKGLSAKEFLTKALDRVIPHLEGAWSGAAYIPGGAGPELAASHGEHKSEEAAKALPAASGWLDPFVFVVALSKGGAALGHVVFRSQKPVPKEERDELARELGGISDVVAAGLENNRAA